MTKVIRIDPEVSDLLLGAKANLERITRKRASWNDAVRFVLEGGPRVLVDRDDGTKKEAIVLDRRLRHHDRGYETVKVKYVDGSWSGWVYGWRVTW